MEKSFVTIGQKLCKVTGKPYESGELLLDRKMRNKFEKHTVTGWGFSPEVQEKINEGFVPLVSIDIEKSEVNEKGNINPEGAYRTGQIAYVKQHVLKELLGSNAPSEMAFVDDDFIEFLNNLTEK